MPIANPATGETLAELPLSPDDEVNDAVASACDAFAIWSETSVLERARVLFEWRELRSRPTYSGSGLPRVSGASQINPVPIT
jgi:acyl-CoA reductase-like NAD-dependent aldehyde dehydrogenase